MSKAHDLVSVSSWCPLMCYLPQLDLPCDDIRVWSRRGCAEPSARNAPTRRTHTHTQKKHSAALPYSLGKQYGVSVLLVRGQSQVCSGRSPDNEQWQLTRCEHEGQLGVASTQVWSSQIHSRGGSKSLDRAWICESRVDGKRPSEGPIQFIFQTTNELQHNPFSHCSKTAKQDHSFIVHVFRVLSRVNRFTANRLHQYLIYKNTPTCFGCNL